MLNVPEFVLWPTLSSLLDTLVSTQGAAPRRSWVSGEKCQGWGRLPGAGDQQIMAVQKWRAAPAWLKVLQLQMDNI